MMQCVRLVPRASKRQSGVRVPGTPTHPAGSHSADLPPICLLTALLSCVGGSVSFRTGVSRWSCSLSLSTQCPVAVTSPSPPLLAAHTTNTCFSEHICWPSPVTPVSSAPCCFCRFAEVVSVAVVSVASSGVLLQWSVLLVLVSVAVVSVTLSVVCFCCC